MTKLCRHNCTGKWHDSEVLHLFDSHRQEGGRKKRDKICSILGAGLDGPDGRAPDFLSKGRFVALPPQLPAPGAIFTTAYSDSRILAERAQVHYRSESFLRKQKSPLLAKSGG